MALADQLAQGIQFAPPPDPFAQYAKMQQLQQGQQANQLNQMEMAKYQRAAEETNALRRLDRSSPDYVNQLYRISPTQGLAYEKSVAESKNLERTGRKTEAEILNLGATGRKTQSDIDKNKLEQQLKITEVASSVLRGVRDQATYDQAKRALSYLVPAESLADYPQAYDPGFVNAEMAMGQTLTQRLTSENAARVAATGERTAATGEGQLKVSQGNLAVNQGQLQVARDRLSKDSVAPTIAQIVDPANPNQMITIDARRYKGGGAGSPGVIGVAGKEPSAALRTNKVEAGKSQLADDLDNLRTSFQTLNDLRAIPSTERGVMSNIGSATAASGIGQMLGRATGTEAQVERDVINSARQRLVNSIKNATGMSAQQLNSNVELQTMLKSISDPGQSIQAAMRIIDDIEAAYVTGNGTLPKRNMPSAVSGKVVPAAAAPNLDALLNKYK
jgi:hypothetical protein